MPLSRLFVFNKYKVVMKMGGAPFLGTWCPSKYIMCFISDLWSEEFQINCPFKEIFPIFMCAFKENFQMRIVIFGIFFKYFYLKTIIFRNKQKYFTLDSSYKLLAF